MKKTRSRAGSLLIEAIVAAGLLMTTITLVSVLSIQVLGVWKDVRQHRIAVTELSNQLEALTILPADDLSQALSEIQAHATTTEALAELKISGTTSTDQLGTRVTLEISWQRSPHRKSLRLCGWSHPSLGRDLGGAADESTGEPNE
ncbi:MAG: hypothetical protein AAGA03_19970 [Planctomycetota bacterium]